MKAEEVVGLIGILLGLFLFGILINLDYIRISILITIGGLFFFIFYTKNSYAIFGLSVLIFALLLHLFFQSPLEITKNQVNFVFPENYIPTIILFLIIIFGFALAYKSTGK